MDQSSSASINDAFEYDEEIFLSCAESLGKYSKDRVRKLSSSSSSLIRRPSRTKASIGSEYKEIDNGENDNRSEVTAEGDDDCGVLYGMHQRHYGRTWEHTSSEGRYGEFLRNVRFIHRRNEEIAKGGGGSGDWHSVQLNHLSDLRQDDGELPVSVRYEDDSEGAGGEEKGAALEDGYEDDDLPGWVSSQMETLNGDRSAEEEGMGGMKVVQLSTAEDVRAAMPDSAFFFFDGGPRRLAKSKSHGVDLEEEFVADAEKGSYERQLNWATEHNPDGVRLVHPASFQGACGSCWAFAATGTLEASISRHAAYAELQAALRHATAHRQHNHSRAVVNRTQLAISERRVRTAAIAGAQLVEQSTFRKAYLSVQELVDCDNKRDHGCTGGNPLLAYPYIHRYGLVSDYIYPYTGLESKCRWKEIAATSFSSSSLMYYSFLNRKRKRDVDIATASSWGVLTSNDEANMETVLRYVGPIAVGFDGSDPSFMMYSGGIYDSTSCRGRLNHALLIVGYGQQPHYDGAITKYWIARNSWGQGWGEDGFVRIKRGDGTKSVGVCGINKNPNVALGGYFEHTGSSAPTDDFKAPVDDYNNTPKDSPPNTLNWRGTTLDQALPQDLPQTPNPHMSITYHRYFHDVKGFALLYIFAANIVGLIMYRIKTYRKNRTGKPLSIHTKDNENSEEAHIAPSSTTNHLPYGSLDTVTLR